MQNGYQEKMTFVHVDRTMGMEGPGRRFMGQIISENSFRLEDSTFH